MDTIKIGTGMSDQEAWSASCHLFCLTKKAPQLGR